MPRLRRIAGAVMRRFQGLDLYRKIGRRMFSRVRIREATASDRLAVQLWFHSPDRPNHPFPSNPLVTEWAARCGGRLAGFVQLVRHPPEHFPYTGDWLFGLFVKPLYQGFGLGEKLSQAVIERASAEGSPTLDLLVNEDNDRAIRLYLKLGFVRHTIEELEPRLEREREISGRRRIVMRKRLGNSE
jgi:GNAT superfamily N-acetyltransferase